MIGEASNRQPYPFDPSYGYDIDALLSVDCPVEPSDFKDFWERRYQQALQTDTSPSIEDTHLSQNGWSVFRIQFNSTGNSNIAGWLLLPKSGKIESGFVIGHGYGGRQEPDFHLPFENAALLFPCSRGLSLSATTGIPDNANEHVIHGIESKESYIHGECVEDVWTAVSALESLYPELSGKINYLGISFGGGIGALALAWDKRIQKAHFNVPSFGNQALRLTLPTWGSGNSVQQHCKNHPDTLANTLAYFDAAIAARHITVPVHCALALYDPMVAPPGQFAIYNAIQSKKQLFQLTAGHHEYPTQFEEDGQLLDELKRFFM